MTKGEQMTIDEQLDHWVAGNSIHNATRDECCPDFSCCNDKIDTPLELRQKFKDADDEARFGMLGMFLGGAIATIDDAPNVVVLGTNEGTA